MLWEHSPPLKEKNACKLQKHKGRLKLHDQTAIRKRIRKRRKKNCTEFLQEHLILQMGY